MNTLVDLIQTIAILILALGLKDGQPDETKKFRAEWERLRKEPGRWRDAGEQ